MNAAADRGTSQSVDESLSTQSTSATPAPAPTATGASAEQAVYATSTSRTTATTPDLLRNRFDAREWAGAFGDLGTLIPFVVGYIAVAGMDPFGVLLAFGAALVFTGFFYRTPMPVQPMKAIGAIATAQGTALALTPATIAGAGLITGLLWLVLGMSGLAQRLARLVTRPVTAGVILGLGLLLSWQALNFIATNWLLGAVAAAVTMVLLRVLPLAAMPALLLSGVVAAFWMDPALVGALAQIEPSLHAPVFALAGISWNEFAVAALALALPQVPLTLGNGLIAVTSEHNRLFPGRPQTQRTVSLTTGAINIGSSLIGGVPMCHGAGGLAGHVRFGARTGGAPVMLGGLLLGLALFFSDSVATLFRLFPTPILGVILLAAGIELMRGAGRPQGERGARLTMLATAALCLWHVGLAFLVGLALQFVFRLPRPGQ
jgi:MFS superfamily sulfate permease-like transporter